MNKSAATKRNNRKIHTRKFLATPEGKAWLERKQAEEALERTNALFASLGPRA